MLMDLVQIENFSCILWPTVPLFNTGVIWLDYVFVFVKNIQRILRYSAAFFAFIGKCFSHTTQLTESKGRDWENSPLYIKFEST